MSQIERWRSELAKQPRSEGSRELRSRIEHLLDTGCGSQILKNPVAAKLVQDALLFFRDSKYTLHAWVVMPNHVHVLLTPAESIELGQIVRSIKTFTSREIHLGLGGEGRLWHRDFFDVVIRDTAHFERVRKYIEWNPVKAGLCADPLHWPYSSACSRAQTLTRA